MVSVRRRGFRHQQGAETVEFMLTLLLFLFVFFMIVEFAIVTYDRGTINNAAREGARQASLYWIDPVLFDPETPLENQRLKRSMVDTVMTWAEQILIDPASAGLDLTLQVDGADMAGSSVSVGSSSTVSVDIGYGHQYIGLQSFGATSAGLTLSTQSGAGVE
jgi:Flp pilus assembly protein TadG